MLKRVDDIVDDMVYYNECPFTGMFTVSTLEKGGAIVCDKKLSVSVEKFKQAMDFSRSVRKLVIFNRTGKF